MAKTTVLRGRKITNKKGKRVKVPMFLPKGPRPTKGWSEAQIATARRKQDEWIAANQCENGKAVTEKLGKTPLGGARHPKEKTSLNFLGELRQGRQSGWTIEQARKFVECIQNDMVDETYGGYRFDADKAAKVTGMSKSSCQFMLVELKKAYASGYSLEQYFRLGRPYRQGAKVLA